MARNKPARLRIIPLGGLGEVGKNMTVVEYGEDIIVIDAGLMFPEEEMLGIDLVLPDITYLRQNQNRIRAIIITHGHEDHTGALPYILKDVKAPVYGTKLTLGFIRAKLDEFNLTRQTKLKEIDVKRKLKVGCFTIEFIRVCHSIPDGVALAIDTPAGIVVHTGDFKLDQTPVDGRPTEYQKLSALGSRNVLLLMSDSTNAEENGFTEPEKIVGKSLENLFAKAQGRIIVACFASHVHRMQQIIDAAKKSNRKVAIVGRSMVTNTAIANELGYLRIPRGLQFDIRDLKHHRDNEVLILTTGSQGEPMSALSRMASRTHKMVTIEPGDTIVISATPVPGNEAAVSRTINQLYRSGADVQYESIAGVHVSGHASREELKMMISMVRPRFFMPVHGQQRHLHHHAQLANEMGIDNKNIIIAENGDVVEFDERRNLRLRAPVTAGVVLVDGLGVGDIGDVVLRDRHQLSQDGIFIVVLTVDQQLGHLVSAPEIISRGFVYVKESGELIEGARERIIAHFQDTPIQELQNWQVLRGKIRDTLGRYLYDKTKRRPMIIPIIVEV